MIRLMVSLPSGSPTSLPCQISSITVPVLFYWRQKLSNPLSIVFVHGFQGHDTKTWTSSSLCWPKDLLPFARVITFRYHPLPTTEPRPQIRDLAKMLLDSITVNRSLSRDMTRPLIFVAHSLGGLIVKDIQSSSCIGHRSDTDAHRLFSIHKLYDR